ncbi:MAG: hypothetical protein OCD02_12080 [Spirochaetaceae bacterium]
MRIFLFVLPLFLLSCRSTPSETYESRISEYFNNNDINDWLAGLELINKTPENQFILLYEVYLDPKFSLIRDEVADTILGTMDRQNYVFPDVIFLVQNSEQVLLITQLASKFRMPDKLRFSETCYLLESSDIKSELLQGLGETVLDYSNALNLYISDEILVKAGVIQSAGYIVGTEVQHWLVERLYEENTELSTGAVFSLSKHGSYGLSLLAKNLLYLSNRLILVSLDILSFNKVEDAYPLFAELLVTRNELIEATVVKAYSDLGLKGKDYIVDALRICHPEIRLTLLNLLNNIGENDFLEEILYLIEYPELQKFILELYFNNSAVDLIREVLLNYNLDKIVINYAIQNNDKILFNDYSLTEYTLNYFLLNYDPEIVYNYFTAIGFEDNYINDYSFMVEIFNELNYIEEIDSLNGEIEYVTKYFELEDSSALAQKENETFFKGMENWLETKDNIFLDESLAVRETNNPRSIQIRDLKKIYLKSLNEEQYFKISDYEKSKKNVVANYRKLTYRLKDFARTHIYHRGYLSLLL